MLIKESIFQCKVQVVVKDEGGNVLEGVTVKINDVELSSKTNSAGSVSSTESFSIGSKVSVEGTLEGYYPGKTEATIKDKNGQEYTVNVKLEKLPGNLDNKRHNSLIQHFPQFSLQGI